jgi:hypothetical protein
MRKLGYLLVIVGFLAVMHLASSRISHALWVAREQQQALPPQDTFTRKEVADLIQRATLANRQSGTAAVLPGFLMVCGAILLACAKSDRKAGDNVANKNAR